MAKLETEPRLQGQGLPAALIEWCRRVVQAVNPLVDSDAAHTTQLAEGWQPGDFKFSGRVSTPPGWIPASTTSIGNVGSGASYANALALALFTHWWTEFTNAQLPILTSVGGASTRGASAAADWAALKRLTVPTATDRYIRTSGASAPTTLQADTVKDHTHGIPSGTSSGGALIRQVVTTAAVDQGMAVTTGSSLGASTETRPVTLVLQGFWKL